MAEIWRLAHCHSGARARPPPRVRAMVTAAPHPASRPSPTSNSNSKQQRPREKRAMADAVSLSALLIAPRRAGIPYLSCEAPRPGALSATHGCMSRSAALIRSSSRCTSTTTAVSRLGLPSTNMQDAAQGFRTIFSQQIGQVTAFPSALAAAATWDPALVFDWASAIGVEFRTKVGLLRACVHGHVVSEAKASTVE